LRLVARGFKAVDANEARTDVTKGKAGRAARAALVPLPAFLAYGHITPLQTK